MTGGWSKLACWVVAGLMWPGLAWAGGPLDIGTESRTPWRYDTPSAVPWNPDKGSLGAIGNSQAVDFIADAMASWEGVETSSLAFVKGDALPANVTAANVGTYFGRCDGLSPIIFDQDGSITEAFFGSGARCQVLGFAGPDCYDARTGRIFEGVAVINGAWVDGDDTCETSEDELLLTVAHELGHMVGLGHSQVNGIWYVTGNPVPGFTSAGVPPVNSVALMFPSTVPGFKQTLAVADDIAWISWLYPSDAFGALGAAGGTVYENDGLTPLQGVNLVARVVSDPYNQAISAVSGSGLPGPGGQNPIRGDYELPGMDAGATYVLSAEEVYARFVGGSSIPPLDPPADIDPRSELVFFEYWNGENEAGSDPPDNPALAAPLVPAAGEVIDGVDILLNDIVIGGSGCIDEGDCAPGQTCYGGMCLDPDATPTTAPTPTQTAAPTATAAAGTTTAAPTPVVSTPVPTAPPTASPVPTELPSPLPTASPVPTEAPSPLPTASLIPTALPTAPVATVAPTAAPTSAPTASVATTASPIPTAPPTDAPPPTAPPTATATPTATITPPTPTDIPPGGFIPDPPDEPSCACASPGSGPSAALVPLVLVGLLRRRRVS